MKCKEGDLAIIIKSSRGISVGRIVTCIKFMGTVYGERDGKKFRILQPDVWLIDQRLTYTNGQELPYVSDDSMMPIGNIDNFKEMEKENALAFSK